MLGLSLGIATKPASAPFENAYSVLFDGADDFMLTGADSTLAGVTYSWWMKGTQTDDYTVFDHGSAIYGAFSPNRWVDSKVLWQRGSSNYTYFVGDLASEAPQDNNWHHWLLYAPLDITDTELFIDGIAQAQSGLVSSGSAGAYPSGIRLGRGHASDLYFPGNIDEFAIFSGDKTSSVAAIYGTGSPSDLTSLSPEHWWRMGDSDSGAGNFVTDVVATDGEALFLPGVAGNDAGIPDADDLDGFGAFTFEVDATLEDWTPPSSLNTLMSKYDTSSQRAWYLAINTGGIITLVLSESGTGPEASDSTVSTGLADGTRAKIRASRTASAGVITFEVDSGSGFVQLGDTVANPRGTLHNSTAGLFVGSRGGGANPVLGKIHRARVWSDATQTTNVLDIDFALQSVGATSFTATSGQVVTVHSTAIDNPAAIRGATDGVLANSPAMKPDVAPSFSYYKVLFDGTDDYMTFSTPTPFSGQTLNTFDCTLSAWAKFNTIERYEAIISLGTYDIEIAPTSATEVGIWVDNAAYGGAVYAPTMGVWNHYVATKSGNTYTLYVNGVQIGQNDDADNATVGVTSFIGHNGSSEYFDGETDECALWTSALSAAQVASIWNDGVPADLTSLSPVSWWRMGEDNGGTGLLVSDHMDMTLGSELVTNGSFDADSDWTKGTGWSISGGNATSDNSQTGASALEQSLSLVNGVVYEITYDWSVVSLGATVPYLGSDTTDTWDSTTGTGLVLHLRYTGATGASNFRFFTGADSDGTFDNISVKPVNGNPGTLENGASIVP